MSRQKNFGITSFKREIKHCVNILKIRSTFKASTKRIPYLGPLEDYKQILAENRVGQASDRFMAAEQILQNIKTTKVFGKEGFFLNKFSLASKYKISAQINALEDNDADAVYSPWAKFEFNADVRKTNDPGHK